MTRSAAPTIVAALRTPIGTAGKAFAGLDAAHLAAPVLQAVASASPPPAEVVLGNCLGPGGNVARVASLAAGLPLETPALTIDRQCASGLAAIGVGAALVQQTGRPILAGGVESASTAPWRFWPPTDGGEAQRYERAPFAPPELGDPDMGVAADELAERRGIERARQDAYAARSHQRAWEACRAGAFDGELVPVGSLRQDERPRAGMTSARLARFPAAFRPRGTVTAGNSCGINDGAAVVAIAPAAMKLPGLQILSIASAGVDPTLPGLGMVPAITRVLADLDLTLADIDVIELNEAFAGQVLACCDALDLDPQRVCTQGGALAIGHPWGASGAVLAVRLFAQMMAGGQGQFGLAAIAAGGGQGVAIVVQACH